MNHRTVTDRCRGWVRPLASQVCHGTPIGGTGRVNPAVAAAARHAVTAESAGGVGAHPPRIDATGRSR
jgi:hypothetical protein